MNCPKCAGEMEEGLQVDAAPGGARQAVWIKGKDLPTINVTLFPPSTKVMGERYLVMGYRCKECGFLEYYAKEKA
ncbi:MAG TPA: PF20097 family protein [Gemmataceae bacterium]|nr:PF20097 family protein [Gemmataceae bacterium]